MSDWWSKKLGTPVAPAPSAVQPPAVARTQQTYQQPQQPQQQQPEGITQGGKCPECRSGNYLPSDRSSRARCYDCGYPITQTSSGINTLVRPAGEVVETLSEATRQVSTANNYRPNEIVGRL